jgi:hypothetical protein
VKWLLFFLHLFSHTLRQKGKMIRASGSGSGDVAQVNVATNAAVESNLPTFIMNYLKYALNIKDN